MEIPYPAPLTYFRAMGGEPETREPVRLEVVPGITAVDTGMVGQRELNSVYVIEGPEPTLVEAGPGADGPVVVAALDELGIGPADLAHIVVTHIHLDHAGGAGALLRRFSKATLWVHEKGAPHLVDPSRLVASTARTYGEERMRTFYGETVPVDPRRIRVVSNGDRIELGNRVLDVLHTPGHASHHVAFLDDVTGAIFTGEATGSYLPWAPCYRPALPPPEVDLEQALASIEAIRERRPTWLLTSHFGPVENAEAGCEQASARIRSWAGQVRAALERDPDASTDLVAEGLRALAERDFLADAGRSMTDTDLARYDALGSIRMNAEGLSRYWRKRWEREGTLGAGA